MKYIPQNGTLCSIINIKENILLLKGSRFHSLFCGLYPRQDGPTAYKLQLQVEEHRGYEFYLWTFRVAQKCVPNMKTICKVEFLSQEESNPPKCIKLGIDLLYSKTKQQAIRDELSNPKIKPTIIHLTILNMLHKKAILKCVHTSKKMN